MHPEGGMDNFDEVNPGDTIMLMDDEDLVTFILLTRFFSGEHEYVALTSADEDSEPDEIVVILNRIERSSDGTYLVDIEDEDEYDRVSDDAQGILAALKNEFSA